MNCPNCNQPLPSDTSAFCPNCGARIGAAPVPAAPGVPVQTVPSHLALGIISTLCCYLGMIPLPPTSGSTAPLRLNSVRTGS